MSRTYFPHRRAYFPRLWLLLPVPVPVVIAMAFLTDDPWVGATVGALAGTIVVTVRVKVWRRRHPVITPEQYLDDMRANAPWN